ncbi:sugar ABC transporter substrate-binding protein [Subtercola boreus]|uniref:Sugar ABC transporter substrate-binding protein n=1 Tax=Subtercola boreus TaxID=120213 RepID=A0A3E0VM18_9MICO|nr:sugar ABC transporter substrate-binding protein [Subtercola boreus]RFA10725.1 sugar ABC transporter substrate-binding protein [Subtercola boreus]TQL55712.1 monosaccharide ABC transporter substrate-binding protein (CUT2 family) [Subtercola boreus]
MTFSKLSKPQGLTRKRLRNVLLVAPAVVAMAALAGCSPQNGGTAASTGSADDSNVNLVVIGGASDDVFFSTVKRGIDDAAKVPEASGAKVTYLALKNYDNLGPDVAQLITNALGMKPSAIAVPDWVPTAEDPAIQSVIAAGIPVVIYNAGTWDQADKLGAMTYIGTDEYLAGKAAGEALGKAGSKSAVCVNTVPGSTNLEDRCSGVKDGMTESGGTSEQLALPATSFGNATAVTQAIKSNLQQNTATDAIVTVGGSDSEAAFAALTQAGSSAKFITFGNSTTVDERIQAGTQLAFIDQQPYAQGFYSVSAMWQYVAYGLELPTKPILTGPAVITKDNVAAVVSGSQAGVR